MSFFYDLNKKLDSIRATPELTHQQLNERDMGKHNNATTGFAALAKKTGGGEKGAKIAGAQLAKMREKGQVEEDFGPGRAGPNRNQAGPPNSFSPDADNYKTPTMDRYLDTVQRLDKMSGQGYSAKNFPGASAGAWEGDGRGQTKYVNRTEPGIMNTLKNKLGYDMPDPAYGPRPDERERLAKRYPVKEDDATPQDVASYKDEVKAANAPKSKASAPTRTAPKPPAKPKPSGAMDDEIDESAFQADEGNAFLGAVVRAKRDGIQPGEKINVGGKEYPVKEAAKYRDPKYKDQLYTQNPPEDDADTSLDTYYDRVKPAGYQGAKRLKGGDEYSRTDPLTRGFGRSGTGSPVEKGPRKGLPKRDQITSLKGSIKDASGTHTPAKFSDKVDRAKKEVDEMLGQVAADAMKNALGGGRGRNAEMDEGHFDDTPTRRRSSSGGEIDTSKPGSTVHRAVKGNYSGAAHSGEERRAAAQADAADERGPRAGRRTVGAGKGTKIGAKINRGTSKLMTREGDQDPADQGEYGREGESSRNNIHTMMRNAKQLEKMLGNEDNLPEWVQEKLTLASDYMQTIADYLASERETDAEDETGMELAEKKSVRSKPKQSNGNDGNLANNAKPYDKVTRGDVVAGRLGKDEMGGKKKSTKPSAKKEEEVEESTTAGSVATAPTSGKAGKGGMSFGKGIYDSIDRAVERQINESMNISMSMNNEGGGAGQTLTITATDEDASQLAQLLRMAGMGVSTDSGDYTTLMPHSGEDDLADQIRQAEQGHGGEEVCSGCGMSDCGCDEMVDETYGDNVVDMNSPNYPTNTESAQDNFGYSGGVNKPKRDVAGNGQTTVPVTAVRGQDNDFQESIQRMREIAGIKETPSIFFPDPKDAAKQLGISTTRLIDTPTSMSTGSNRSYNNTFLDPAQKAQQRLSKQNESIFTDTANLWKSYKG